jgi:putative tricarboxylic transport membrane protein
VKLLRVPYSLLALVVVVICVVGAYSVHNSTFDVGVMIGFGIFGYLLRKTGFPAAPLVLAMILGPILERSLQQAMISSAGDPLIFVTHPLSAALLAVAALVALTPLIGLVRGGAAKPA